MQGWYKREGNLPASPQTMGENKGTTSVEITPHTLRVLLRSRWDADSAAWIDSDLRAATDFDWDALLEAARQARAAPLLHQVLHDREWVPSRIRNALRMDLFGVARQNLIAMNALAAILDELSDAGIPHIVLKGAALALTLYKNEGLRPMCDIDLLVPHADVPHVLTILERIGFFQQKSDPHPGMYLTYANVIHMQVSEPETLNLDLHWCLLNLPHYRQKIHNADLWDNAIPLPVLSVPGRTLEEEAQLVHLCGHLLLHGEALSDYGSLLWEYDIALYLSERAADLDWNIVVKRASTWDLLVPLQQVLPLMTSSWGLILPNSVLASVDSAIPSQMDSKLAHLRTSGRKGLGMRILSKTYHLPSRRHEIKYLAGMLFPSTSYMRERYGMPHPILLPFYYAYRWLRGLGLIRR